MKVKFEIEEGLVPLLRESLAKARDSKESTGSEWLDGVYTRSIDAILESIEIRSEVPNELEGLAESYAASFGCMGDPDPELDNEWMNAPMGQIEPDLSRKHVEKTRRKRTFHGGESMPDWYPAAIALRADGYHYRVIAANVNQAPAVVRAALASLHMLWKELQETPHGEARYNKLKGWFPNWRGTNPVTLREFGHMIGIQGDA